MKTVFMGSTTNPADHIVNEARINHICQNNDHAKAFLKAYSDYAHMIDDAVDGDLKGDIERVVRVNSEWTGQLLFNPFVEKIKGVIYPVMMAGLNAWADSEIATKHPDIRIRRAADVLKSYHAEIIYQIAYHVGGYDHMREVSKMWRTFDFDFQDEPEETKPE